MSKLIENVEIITGHEHCRRTSADEKVRLVDEIVRPGMTVSATARLYGLSPSLLFGWRPRMSEGGFQAVRTDEDVVPASRLREVLDQARSKELSPRLPSPPADGSR